MDPHGHIMRPVEVQYSTQRVKRVFRSYVHMFGVLYEEKKKKRKMLLIMKLLSPITPIATSTSKALAIGARPTITQILMPLVTAIVLIVVVVIAHFNIFLVPFL